MNASNHKIINQDCLSGMKEMPESSVDIVITSPPYNIGKKYNSYKDDISRKEYLSWMKNISTELFRILRSDGSFFLNIGSTSTDPWIAMDVANVFRNDFILQNNIVWAKAITVKNISSGHFKPISSKRFLNQNHESVFHFTKTGDVPVDRLAIGCEFQDKTNIARRGHIQDKRCAGNIWFLPYETVVSKAQKFNHPAAFPVALAEHCLKLSGKTACTVLDPFLGSGTTMIAAHRLGHNCVGFEIDEEYSATSKARLEAEIGRV